MSGLVGGCGGFSCPKMFLIVMVDSKQEQQLTDISNFSNEDKKEDTAASSILIPYQSDIIKKQVKA